MAFENVDVSSLRNALTQCKDSLNYKTTDELINSISNTSIWQSLAQKNLKNALTKLSNERYKKLEDKINSYFDVVSYIEKYQNLRKENLNLEAEYSSLSNHLYYEEEYTTTNRGKNNELITETHSRTVKNTDVERQIVNIQTKISNNKEEMEILENRVANSI